MLRFLNVTATATKFTNSWNWKIWLADRRHLLGPFVLFSVAYGRLEVMLFVSGALVAQLDLVVGIHDAPTSALTEEALPGYDLSKELPRKKKSSKPRCLGGGLNCGTVPGIHPRLLYQGDTRLRHSGEVDPCVLWLELQPDLAVDRCCHGGLVRLEVERTLTALHRTVGPVFCNDLVHVLYSAWAADSFPWTCDGVRSLLHYRKKHR